MNVQAVNKRGWILIALVALVAAILPVLTASPANADDPTITPIYDIQGDGQFSPVAWQIHTTIGVVTAITANGRDMWIQDPEGDDNPATSDGILVDDRDRLDPLPQVGDLIMVTGQVEERQFYPDLPVTRLDDVHFRGPYEVISSGNPLPAPSELSDQPESVEDAIVLLESVEGMRVSVKNGTVVSPTSRFGEFALLTKKDAKQGSGYEPSVKQILLRDLSQDPNMVDYNPERILVDDFTLDDAIVVQPGDIVQSIVGVMDYSFGNYKIQPTETKITPKPIPNSPQSVRNGPSGDTTITTFNVENLFDLVLNTPTNVDVFGQIGFDPGSSWGPPSTKDNTLQRKPAVCAGDPDGSDPFDPAIEWEGFGTNNFDGLGSHTVTCGSSTDLFISQYIEGTSYNKAIEVYNGTGESVNLGTLGYTIEVFFNGNTSAGTRIGLSGTIAAGDVFVLADERADPAILAQADQLTRRSLFNGDDAVALVKGGKDDGSSTPTPEELETQLTKLAMAIDLELQLPEIMVLQEVENTEIAQELGDRVNAAAGTDYVAVSFETSDGRGIEVAFLYDDDRVDVVDVFQLSGPDVEAAFGAASASPGREPLYGEFLVDGKTVHIVGNHFKSKGGDTPIFGIVQPFERPTEVQRKMQAQAVRDFVDTLLAADPGAMVMVTGDLNDFQFGEHSEGPGHPIGILEGIGGDEQFTNLVNMEKEQERWTFLFDGNSQVLDHMLVNDMLLKRLAGIDILHFNAAFPSDLGADPTTTLRASDHDAIEGRFTFGR
ncbi:MAG: lamin tail domain-containing protein [Actinomycetota bacterium]|nr:lamin tail domain-containing protein [Actinomycetota bacterium]